MDKMLKSADIEKQIEKYTLSFNRVRDKKIEWGTPLPMFVKTFNELISKTGIVPSQDEFVERYFGENIEELKNIIADDGLKIGLEARIRRAYPSFVRDLHFYSLLREHGLNATRSEITDIEGGVDHIIEYRGTRFFIHCYVATTRGRYGRKIKNTRHRFEGKHIDLPLELGGSDTRVCGQFFLYSEKHIHRLILTMDENIRADD